MRIFRLLPIFSFAVLLFTGCGSALKSGQKAFLRGDYSKAAQELDKATNKLEVKHPDYNIVKLNLALALWEKGEYKSAQAAFKDVAFQIWGDDINWLTDLTKLTGGIKNESKREWYGQENEQIYIRIFTGLIYMLNKEYDEAIVEFRRVSEKNDNYPIAEYLWGMAARELEDENSVVHFKNAEKLTKNMNPYIKLNRAYIAALNGDKEEAQVIYREVAPAISDNPGVSNLDSFLENGTNICVLIEKNPNTTWHSDVRITIQGKEYGRSFYLDNNNNRESLKSALVKGVASRVGQELRNQLTGKVPGLSLVVGGSRKSEVKRWHIMPNQFNIFETYIAPGTYEITVQTVDKNGRVKSSTTKSAKVFGGDLTLLPIML